MKLIKIQNKTIDIQAKEKARVCLCSGLYVHFNAVKLSKDSTATTTSSIF